MNIDRATEVIAWTIRARCVRYGIAFIPVDGLDIDNLAAEIAANLRDPPVQFRTPDAGISWDEAEAYRPRPDTGEGGG